MNTFEPLQNEKVLHEAKVGKHIFHFYFFLQIVCGLIGSGIFVPGAIWYNTIPGGKSYTLLIVGGFFYLAALFLFFHYRSTRNRRYVLTNKRIVLLKGGKMKHVDRSLVLKSIQGVEKCNNFLYDRYGLATIDFYALAVASNKTKVKIFSFSSTDFKFQWVDKQDAEIVYKLTQEYLVNGEI